jgi:hypothetical protein
MDLPDSTIKTCDAELIQSLDGNHLIPGEPVGDDIASFGGHIQWRPKHCEWLNHMLNP